tara:strand:+ start:354 stop:635 length:282 start_codon:yes stop_codon:yes gene_type:complete
MSLPEFDIPTVDELNAMVNAGADASNDDVSGTEDTNTRPTGVWWKNFFGGATNLANSIMGSNPQVDTKVDFDKKQLMMIGGGLLVLLVVWKKL